MATGVQNRRAPSPPSSIYSESIFRRVRPSGPNVMLARSTFPRTSPRAKRAVIPWIKLSRCSCCCGAPVARCAQHRGRGILRIIPNPARARSRAIMSTANPPRLISACFSPHPAKTAAETGLYNGFAGSVPDGLSRERNRLQTLHRRSDLLCNLTTTH